MASFSASSSPSGRTVSAETLTVAPVVLGRTLAAPWQRAAAMLVDLVVVGLLSLLSRPFLGVGTGALLLVLLGNAGGAPLVLRTFRWIFRLLGAGLIVVSAIALGHGTLLRDSKLNLAAWSAPEDSAAMKQDIVVTPNASWGELRSANDKLQDQVEDLKAEIHEQRKVSSSLTNQARATTRALGVTFGWSGVYFTLLAGLLNGRTLGKLLLRCRAVRINGAKLTFFDAFIRHGGYVAGVAMGLIGFLKLLWEPNRQAVEDRIAGTVVVRE